MRKHARFFLWCLIALTIFVIFIDLPGKITIGKKTFSGSHVDINIGNFHIQRDFPFREGLDLQGGTSVTLRADMSGIPQSQRDDALNGASDVISRRINLFGVSEPLVQTAKVNNDYRILVDLPGVDVNQVIDLVGKTAQLTFWESGTKIAPVASSSALPLGIMQFLQFPQKTDLTGKDLQNATVTFDPNSGKPQVQLAFTGDGVRKFGDITKRNVGKVVAIVLDNQVIEAPTVSVPILDGNAVITGGFTSDQAKSLSIQLKAGALPVPLSVLAESTVGATLGNQSLRQSLFAGLLGFIVIVIFMIVLYGRLGVVASLALCLYTLVVLAIFKLIPVTLTLAGIAGFILSIGMAVDANILIFERMKEELRAGKSQNIAIELGFSRAWTSIRDSNISTLITSLVLYKFGTGIVRGFAVTLAIGVIISMFSAIIATRTFIRNFYAQAKI